MCDYILIWVGLFVAIRLEKLYKQAKQTYQMQLVAGKRSLGNIVNWVHMIEDENVAEFLRGNELVFTTGIGHSEARWLNDFASHLILNNASGLVVNVGPYIDVIPDETIQYCEQMGFPLFILSWEIRLVDITRDFCRRIISSEQVEVSVSSAFKNAIFFPDDIGKYEAQMERHGFNLSWRYCAAVLNFSSPDDRCQENIATIRFYVQNIINRISERYSLFVQDNRLVIIFANFSDSEIAACIDEVIVYFSTAKHGSDFNIGIGKNENGLPVLGKSYKQAVSVLRMAAKNNWSKVYYRDLGIYKILFSTEDDGVLREVYNDVLGKLADYDATNNTDYTSTLKCYLQNNASVQVVAKMTYVHRNTINYKLARIKEITGYNLASVEDRLKIMLAFKIKDIM